MSHLDTTEELVDTNLIILIIAAVFALPGGLFVSFLVSEPRARILSLLGGVIFDVLVAGGIYLYVKQSKMSVDGLSYGLGAFFACSIAVLIGALVANFLTGLASQSRLDSVEG